MQAHFDETCFYIGKNGNKSRKKDAVPSIKAFLLDPESDDDCVIDYFKSRPLYSSPALQDHNYANFTTVVQDWVDPEGFLDCEGNADDALFCFDDQSEARCDLVCGSEQDTEVPTDPIKLASAVPEKENSFKLYR